MVRLQRFDICLVNLDPTMGSEMKKNATCRNCIAGFNECQSVKNDYRGTNDQ